MKDTFLSHVDEDRNIAEAIASELESSGCSVWYYERDSLPGQSYLLQTRQAIDEAKCFLFLVSPATMLRHNQVDKELVRAHESGKKIILILKDTNFRTFSQTRPEWHQAIGSKVAVELSTDTIGTNMPRLLNGLRALGIGGIGEDVTRNEPDVKSKDAESSFVVDGPAVEISGEEIELTVVEGFDEAIGEEFDSRQLLATIVHEHPATGFLADVIVTDSEFETSKSLVVAFFHQLLKPTPYIIEFELGSNRDPIQYFHFGKLIHGFPVVLRVHWLNRLPKWSTFNKSFGVISVPAVRVTSDQDGRLVSEDTAGMLVNGQFKTMIDSGHPLPRIHKKRFKTKRDSQRAISVTPAVRRSDGRIEQFPKLKLSVPAAPAGVAWIEFAFRIDPDGRFTLFARDPLHQMKVRDVIVVQ